MRGGRGAVPFRQAGVAAPSFSPVVCTVTALARLPVRGMELLIAILCLLRSSAAYWLYGARCRHRKSGDADVSEGVLPWGVVAIST